MKEFIAGLPKAELHLHLEGSLEPEQMFEIAKRNQIDIPFRTIEEVKQAYQFSNLQDFLDIYYTGMKVLIEERDFYELTEAYLRKVAASNTRHVEVFFDPQGHTERGIKFETVLNGIATALDVVGKELNISYRLIMCFLRHLSEDSALETLNEAKPYLDKIDGVGLDSSELGNPPEKFKNVFALAKSLDLKLVAHAGEEGPAEYVWQALNILKVDRIDHGNRSLDDDKLVNRIINDGIALTVCPLSNLKLCVVKDMRDHPLKMMLDKGLLVTINSDDPSYFGGYMNENYFAVADALDLSEEALVQLAKNSFMASFLSKAEKQGHIDQLNSYITFYNTEK